MFNAATGGPLERKTWRGCPFNRAGSEVGTIVLSERTAMQAFDLPWHAVRKFLVTWDHLRGSDEHCTQQLLEAILSVGLFTEAKTRRGLWRHNVHGMIEPIAYVALVATQADGDTAAPVIVMADESADDDARCLVGV